MSINFDTQQPSQRLLSDAIKNRENCVCVCVCVCMCVCFDLTAEKSDIVTVVSLLMCFALGSGDTDGGITADVFLFLVCVVVVSQLTCFCSWLG